MLLFRQNFFLREVQVLYQEAGLFVCTCKKGLWDRGGKEKQGQLHNCTQVSFWFLLYKLLSLCHKINPASTLTCSRAFCSLCGILYCRWYEVKNTSRNGYTFNWVLFDTSDTCSNWVMYCQCVSCMHKKYLWSWSCSRMLSPLKISAGCRIDTLGLNCWLICYLMFILIAKYSCLEWHACVNTEQTRCKSHNGIWNTL